MSLLDGGIRSTFGRVFGTIYEDATLTKTVRTESLDGTITETETPHAVKAHAPSRNEVYRASAGFTDGEIEIIILKHNVSVTPNTDDRLTYAGKEYDITAPAEDGAHSHWRIRARLRSVGAGRPSGSGG